MAVRPEMVALVAYLRQHGQAANETDTFHGVTYWTDDQLQQLLDENMELCYVGLTTLDTAYTLLKLDIPRHHYMDTATLAFIGTSGGTISVTYSDYNMYTKVFTLPSTNSSVIGIRANIVNMWKALSDLWGQKAEQRYQYVDSRAGQNVLHLQQEYNHCVSRQVYYANKILKRWKK